MNILTRVLFARFVGIYQIKDKDLKKYLTQGCDIEEGILGQPESYDTGKRKGYNS